MHTAASALRTHFCSMLDSYEQASPIPDPERRREQAVNTMLDSLDCVTGNLGLTLDQTFTHSALCLGSACRIAGVRPRPQDWLAAIQDVLNSGAGTFAVWTSSLFRDELRLRGNNWRQFFDHLHDWLPASTPVERALGAPQYLGSRARQQVQDLVVNNARYRDDEVRFIVSVAMRYLVALGLETRPEAFGEEAGEQFFRPLHDLADRLAIA